MRKVIFACIHNAGRSQMAAAFFNQLADPTKAQAVSAGTDPGVRVHPEVLGAERVPPSLVGKDIWKQRFEDIHSFERYLSRNGTVIRKFFLNVSKKEQKRRFLERLDEPEKNWKFSAADIHEREYWDDYMSAYEDAIQNTASKHAPWYVVPADNKWFTRLVVASAVVETLEDLKLHYPNVPASKRGELQAARKVLEGKNPRPKN